LVYARSIQQIALKASQAIRRTVTLIARIYTFRTTTTSIRIVYWIIKIIGASGKTTTNMKAS